MEKELEPRLAEAKEGKRTVYFVDAAHFVFGAFLGCLWCIVRLFVPTPSGRNRYNILGAIDAITHNLIYVSNDNYINSLSVCELLNKIREKHIGSNPITIVLDNARYQRCSHVIEFAKKQEIELLFLPSYSPNLNIIERFWKWLKKDCLNCKYNETFTQFKQAIDLSLKKTIDKDNLTELDTLLNLKFQLFDNANYNRV